jgi:hypothetical protein
LSQVFFLPLVALFCFLWSCGSHLPQSIFIKEKRKVVGGVQNLDSSRTGLPDFLLYLIDQDGQRIQQTSFEFDPSSLQFSFTLENSKLNDASIILDSDTIPGMGKKIDYLSKDEDKFVRIEIVEQVLDGAQPTFLYGQKTLGLNKTQLLTDNADYYVPSTMGLYPVSRETLLVVDSISKKPITKAKIIPIIQATLKVTDPVTGLSSSKPAWQTDSFRSILHTTDSKGQALIYPILAQSQNAAYQVIAYADKYCTYVSPVLRLALKTDNTIELTPCKRSENQIDIEAILDPTMNTETQKSLGVDRTTYLTNNVQTTLKVVSKSNTLRSLKITLIEGHDDQAVDKTVREFIDLSKALDEGKLFVFESDFTLKIPTVFESTSSSNGLFSIIVESTSEATKGTSRIVFYGNKQVLELPYTYMEDLEIKTYETDGVVSVVNNAAFTISTKECKKNHEIGIKTSLLTTALFKKCNETTNSVSFSKKDLQWNSTLSQTENIKVYLKDAYGNISKDSATNLHIKSVFFDVDYPTLANQGFLVQKNYGFKKVSDPSFPRGIEVNDQFDTIIVSQSLPENSLVFQFEKTETCETTLNTDEISRDADKNTPNNEIYKFALGKTAELSLSAEKVLCNDSGSPGEFPLTANDFQFPENPSENASIFVIIQDPAGNISTPAQLTIPPCPEDLTGISICWKN